MSDPYYQEPSDFGTTAPDFDDGYYDEGPFYFEEDGVCPLCGHRLDHKELIPEADVGVDYCPDCGYEGGIG